MTDAVLSIRALTVDFVVGEEKKRIIKNISLTVKNVIFWDMGGTGRGKEGDSGRIGGDHP